MPDGAGRPPRLLSRAQLRAYLGHITVTELQQRIDAGVLPRPVWGIHPDDKAARWDVRQVDRMLDADAGPTATVEAAERHLDQARGLR